MLDSKLPSMEEKDKDEREARRPGGPTLRFKKLQRHTSHCKLGKASRRRTASEKTKRPWAPWKRPQEYNIPIYYGDEREERKDWETRQPGGPKITYAREEAERGPEASPFRNQHLPRCMLILATPN